MIRPWGGFAQSRYSPARAACRSRDREGRAVPRMSIPSRVRPPRPWPRRPVQGPRPSPTEAAGGRSLRLIPRARSRTGSAAAACRGSRVTGLSVSPRRVFDRGRGRTQQPLTQSARLGNPAERLHERLAANQPTAHCGGRESALLLWFRQSTGWAPWLAGRVYSSCSRCCPRRLRSTGMPVSRSPASPGTCAVVRGDRGRGRGRAPVPSRRRHRSRPPCPRHCRSAGSQSRSPARCRAGSGGRRC